MQGDCAKRYRESREGLVEQGNKDRKNAPLDCLAGRRREHSVHRAEGIAEGIGEVSEGSSDRVRPVGGQRKADFDKSVQHVTFAERRPELICDDVGQWYAKGG